LDLQKMVGTKIMNVHKLQLARSNTTPWSDVQNPLIQVQNPLIQVQPKEGPKVLQFAESGSLREVESPQSDGYTLITKRSKSTKKKSDKHPAKMLHHNTKLNEVTLARRDSRCDEILLKICDPNEVQVPITIPISLHEKSSATIMAISVNTLSLVARPGTLYFVRDIEQFAIKINNILFYGNIGTFHEHNMAKTHSCNGQCKSKASVLCTYYHGKKDIRNFGPRTPKISRDNLISSLAMLSDEDKEIHRNLAMHYLLCQLLIK
jgi:hypothetical protein